MTEQKLIRFANITHLVTGSVMNIDPTVANSFAGLERLCFNDSIVEAINQIKNSLPIDNSLHAVRQLILRLREFSIGWPNIIVRFSGLNVTGEMVNQLNLGQLDEGIEINPGTIYLRNYNLIYDPISFVEELELNVANELIPLGFLGKFPNLKTLALNVQLIGEDSLIGLLESAQQIRELKLSGLIENLTNLDFISELKDLLIIKIEPALPLSVVRRFAPNLNGVDEVSLEISGSDPKWRGHFSLAKRGGQCCIWKHFVSGKLVRIASSDSIVEILVDLNV